jgi:hypothetical protein
MAEQRHDGSWQSDDGYLHDSFAAAVNGDWRHRKTQEIFERSRKELEESKKNAHGGGFSPNTDILKEKVVNDVISTGSNLGLMGLLFFACATLIVIAFMAAAVLSFFEAVYWSWLGYAGVLYAVSLVPNIISLIFEEKVSERAGRIARRSVDFIFIIGVIVAVYYYF